MPKETYAKKRELAVERPRQQPTTTRKAVRFCSVVTASVPTTAHGSYRCSDVDVSDGPYNDVSSSYVKPREVICYEDLNDIMKKPEDVYDDIMKPTNVYDDVMKSTNVYDGMKGFDNVTKGYNDVMKSTNASDDTKNVTKVYDDVGKSTKAYDVMKKFTNVYDVACGSKRNDDVTSEMTCRSKCDDVSKNVDVKASCDEKDVSDCEFAQLSTVVMTNAFGPRNAKQMIVPGSILGNGAELPAQVLLDTGCTSMVVSDTFAHDNGIKVQNLATTVTMYLADGEDPVSILKVTDMLELKMLGRKFKARFLVAPVKYDVILGLPWFEDHNPQIDWRTRDFRFNDVVTAVASVAVDDESARLGQLPEGFEEFDVVFKDRPPCGLPPIRPYDLEIKLRDDSKIPPYQSIYNLTMTETNELKKWIDENLALGYIRPSTSPCAAPIFFVKKKNGGLRPCIDYRQLNANTIPDRFPLPRIDDLLTKLHGAVVFSTLDLKGAYNLVRMKEGDQWKAAFRCKFGHFEPVVVQFGLLNAPAVFQRFMLHIFQPLLDVCVLIYLDDILVFSRSKEEHLVHLRQVFSILRDNHLVVSPGKCSFLVNRVSFLGYVVSTEGIGMDPSKLLVIQNWPAPQSVKQLQSFLGVTNYYRDFIQDYSAIVKPLTDLTRKNVDYIWNVDTERAFSTLKSKLLADVVLLHPDLTAPFVVESDASDYAIGAVLSQECNGSLRPVTFFSRKLVAAEINYTVHDKELLAIVEAFKVWRHFLVGSVHQVVVLSDHKNLIHFRTAQYLKPRHARWSEVLAEVNFVLKYRPGYANPVADALSRAPYTSEALALKGGKSTSVLLPEHLWNSAIEMEDNVTVDGDTVETVETNGNENVNSEDDASEADEEEVYDGDNTSWPELIGYYLEEGRFRGKPKRLEWLKKQAAHFEIHNGRLYRKVDGELKLYLPRSQRRLRLMQYHDNFGHLASKSIIPVISRYYWWPGLRKFVQDYVRACPKCQLARNTTRVPAVVREPGVTPLPPTMLPFDRIGIDFIQNLVETHDGNKHIITCIDYSTRWLIAKAVKKMDISTVLDFLYNDVVMYHGCPLEIVSDRGSSLVSQAVEEFIKSYGAIHLKTTPYHPRTNGMVERVHAMVGHGITTMTDGTPKRWDEVLAAVVWGIRCREHEVTGHSPFYLLFGYDPRSLNDPLPPNIIRSDATTPELDERAVRDLELLGQERAASYVRSVKQAKDMNSNRDGHYFEIGEMVKMKVGNANKFEFSWKGPFIVVGHGPYPTYRLMRPDGMVLDALINQSNMGKWVSDSTSLDVERGEVLRSNT